jgi:hypothetical protein
MMVDGHVIKAFIDLPFENKHGQLHNWFTPLEFRTKNALEQYGVKECARIEDADVLVCFEFNYLKHKDLKIPKVLMYGHDEAALLWEPRYIGLGDPLVKFIVCPNLYRDPETQNMPHLENTRHGAITYEHSNVYERPDSWFGKDLYPKILGDIDLSLLNKVKVWGSMIWQEYYGYCHKTDHCEEHRPIDVNLLGKSYHYDRWSVKKHRTDCLKAVHNLDYRIAKLVSGSNTHKKEEHFESLRQSKICIAPWGFGETTGRDFQGILAGSVVIKPDTRYVMTNPDFYDGSWSTILWCKPDYSDLSMIVEDVLTNWNSHWSQLVKQEQIKMAAVRLKITMVKDFAELIKDAAL